MQQREPTRAEQLRCVPMYVGFSTANSVFCVLTVFGAVFVLFLDELGISKTRIGGLLSLLPLVGVIAPFLAPTIARIGFKRTFLTFFTARKVVMSLILFTPLMGARYGEHGAFLFIGAVLLAFSLCRAVGETALYPWDQEIVPADLRGKLAALNTIVGTLAVCAAMGVSSAVMNHGTGIGRYLLVIGAGVVFGFVAVGFAFFLPGGGPMSGPLRKQDSPKGTLTALLDRSFRRFLIGLGLVMLVQNCFGTFVPLFLKEQVGLQGGQIVILQAATMVGGMATSYLWGWSADRFGSKPVMLSGLSLFALLPAGWILMPRQGPWSVPVALTIALLVGICQLGWTLGQVRLLYVSLVPPDKKTPYMALYYAWIGLMGGLGPLAAGYGLEQSQILSGRVWAGITLDPYMPFFAVAILLVVGALLILSRIAEAGATGTREFAGLFLRGNPMQALGANLRYNLATVESDRINVTEQLGAAKSLLNVEELMEALADPSFNVRYEAIVSIARTRPEPRLLEGLLEILTSGEPDLALPAAWALGRIGDRAAVSALRGGLDAPYPLVRARCARALGMIGDLDSIPELLHRLREEPDMGLRVAYAAGLGHLGARTALPTVLEDFQVCRKTTERKELALAVARILGNERGFVRMWRSWCRAEPETAVSRILLGLQKRIASLKIGDLEYRNLFHDCVGQFEAGNRVAGAVRLSELVDQLPHDIFNDELRRVLRTCVTRLQDENARDDIDILLTLTALQLVARGRRGSAPPGLA